MSGQAPYRLAVGIVRGRTELTLTSPLTGIALDLPAPLNKAAEAAWPLRVETRAAAAAGDGAQRDSLRVELGNVLQAQYLRDLSGESPKVMRGAMAVLDTLPPLPERGVHAVLNLPAVDGDAWQNLAERLQALGGGAADVIAEGYLPHTVALRAQSFTSGGRKLTRLVAGASQDPVDATWRGNLDAEQLGGYIEYRAARGPTNPGRVHARLARLALPPADVASVETLLAQAPATVPALDIVVDDFELRGKKLGRVEIAAVNRAGDRRRARVAHGPLHRHQPRCTVERHWPVAGRARRGKPAHGDGLQARTVRRRRLPRSHRLRWHAARRQGAHERPAVMERLATCAAHTQPRRAHQAGARCRAVPQGGPGRGQAARCAQPAGAAASVAAGFSRRVPGRIRRSTTSSAT